MEKLIPIKEVEEVLAKRQADLYDEIRPSSAVQFISIEEVDVDGRRYQMTRSAQRLFAQKLQVPLDYLSRCPQNLQEVNLNYWIRSLGETPLFVRFERDQVRAVFSTRYKPIDHVDIAGRLGEALSEDREVEFSLSDELMLIRAVNHGQTFKIDGSNGDEISPGIAIVNSETGWSAFCIEAFFLRLVCTNGMITETRFSNRIRHIKENVLAGFANSVSMVSLEAVVMRDNFRISRDQEAADPLASIFSFNRRFGLTKREGEKVVESWDGGKTMFSIINAYTSAANRPELLLEDVYRLQRIGGIILSLVK